MSGKLSSDELNRALSGLIGWQASDGHDAIQKTFAFGDFSAAWAFMSRCALLAEKMDHHPDWSNSYNKVAVQLSSHDVSGVTDRDIRMARAMNSLAG